MKTRTDLLNHLAEKYNLQRYLEIGVQVPELNFDKVKCPYKIGVDPDPAAHATFRCTSDDYFEMAYPLMKPFDLVFIDGMHTAEQVRKDFLNVVMDARFIVLHDCAPLRAEHTTVPRPTKTGHWNGSVYKFALWLTHDILFDDATKSACLGEAIKPSIVVDIDNGCLVFDGDKNVCFDNAGISEMPWSHFDTHRKELLNLISWDEFVKI